MELTEGSGFGMKSTGSVFLGLKSLTNSLSFTILKLEEIWALRQLTDVPTHTPSNDLLPLALSNQIPSIPLLCLSPGSLTGSSAPCTEPTFREIVYQLHSMNSLIPNPGTTSYLP